MDTPSSSNLLHGDLSFREDGELILSDEDKLNEVVASSKAPLVHDLLNLKDLNA